jgi:hypothetical protein
LKDNNPEYLKHPRIYRQKLTMSPTLAPQSCRTAGWNSLPAEIRLMIYPLMWQKNFNLPALCTIECFHPNAGEFGRKPEVTWLRYCCEPQCRKLIGELRKDTHPNGVATWYEHVVDWDTEVSIATETYRPCEEVMTKEMFDTWSWPRPDVCILSPTVVRPVAMFSPPVVDWFWMPASCG